MKEDGLRELRKLAGKVPWLSKDGSLDLTRFPIDSTLKKALARNDVEFGNGISLLKTMQLNGREEAGVFLMGLMVSTGAGEWKRRTDIVEALQGFCTQGCADLLIGEIRKVKSNQTTRVYLNAVLEALSRMPAAMIQKGVLDLIASAGVSSRMREKLEEALWKASRNRMYEDEE